MPFGLSVLFVLFVVRALSFIFSLFPPYYYIRAGWGGGRGGGALADFIFLFSFPCLLVPSSRTKIGAWVNSKM